MLMHIGLTIIVYYGVVNAKRACLPMAIVLHMLMDTFAALYQRGAMQLWAVEVWGAVWTIVTVVIAWKQYKKMNVD